MRTYIHTYIYILSFIYIDVIQNVLLFSRVSHIHDISGYIRNEFNEIIFEMEYR